jgi:hypothetical protein
VDEPYNAAERSHVKAAQKSARFLEKSRGEILRTIMDSAAGRAYMLDRLERSHCFVSSFHGNALSMAFAEGERNIGLQDLNDIMQFAPDQYVLMMREKNERDRTNASRRDNPREPDSTDTTAELIE